MFHRFCLGLFLPLFSFYFSLPLKADQIPWLAKEEPKGFYLLSVPKSGTHLATKLIFLLTGKTQNWMVAFKGKGERRYPKFEEILLSLPRSKKYFCAHPAQMPILVSQFLKEHPEQLMILQIRDLRDVVISFIHHFKSELNELLGPEATLEERLTFVLQSEDWQRVKDLNKNFVEALNWYGKPGVFVCRFEDLVGAKGQGSDKRQFHTIRSLVQQLGLHLNHEEIQDVQKQLFGNEGVTSVTFRSGQIGSWKNSFSPMHLDQFNSRWGHFQQAFGYSLD